MLMRIHNLFILEMVSGFVIAFAGCGGEVPGGAKAHEDGKIFLRNETEIPMQVTYEDEDLGSVELVVQAGEKKDISEAVLEGGTEVTVKVEALATPVRRAEIPITVDGDVTIDIISFGQLGANELEYRLQRIRGGVRGGTTKGRASDGRIFVRNDVTVALTVSYLSEESGLIETVVQPGAMEEVSQGMVKGGVEATVKIVSESFKVRPTDNPAPSHADVKLTVDGNVTIRVFGFTGRRGYLLKYELL